jgi:hypothetical protein
MSVWHCASHPNKFLCCVLLFFLLLPALQEFCVAHGSPMTIKHVECNVVELMIESGMAMYFTISPLHLELLNRGLV